MEQEKGMFSEDSEFEARVDIEYKIIDYKTFSCRFVVVGDKPTGECHIKGNSETRIDSLLARLRAIDTAEVGAVDTSGILQLEYPFFLKVTGIIAQETIYDRLSEIDDQLSN